MVIKEQVTPMYQRIDGWLAQGWQPDPVEAECLRIINIFRPIVDPMTRSGELFHQALIHHIDDEYSRSLFQQAKQIYLQAKPQYDAAVAAKEAHDKWYEKQRAYRQKEHSNWAKSIGGNSTVSWPALAPMCFKHRKGMPQFQVFSPQAELNIFDVPLSYVPPIGVPIDFRVNYNASDVDAWTPQSSNLGPGWSLNWVAYLKAEHDRTIKLTVPGGGSEIYRYMGNAANPYRPNLTSHAILVPISANEYQRKLPDGSIEVYDHPSESGWILLGKIIDPQGNAVSVRYDNQARLVSVIDAIGQVSKISYVTNAVGNERFYSIDRITDPFGRTCSFSYSNRHGELTSITDQLGLTSTFKHVWGSYPYISSMTTPYGTTWFMQYAPPESAEKAIGLRITFPDRTVSVIESWPDGNSRKTYYFDREAMKQFPNDPDNHVYTHATVMNWLSEPTPERREELTVAPVLASMKKSLSSEVKYETEGQTKAGVVGTSNLPTKVTRFVYTSSGGETQAYRYQYNKFGKVTKFIDPIGRTSTFRYAANNVDLLEVSQSTGRDIYLLAKWQYNSSHRPITYSDASGRQTTYTYNNFGELTSVTNASKQSWMLTYDKRGYLSQIKSPVANLGAIVSISYDQLGRPSVVTDAEGRARSYRYDAGDRVTAIEYPDGTKSSITYNRLDAIAFRDRQGRESRRGYDSMQQLSFETDALRRTTQYQWCSCGALHALTDPAGNTTI